MGSSADNVFFTLLPLILADSPWSGYRVTAFVYFSEFFATSARLCHRLSIYGVNNITHPSTVLGIDPGVSGGIACWRHNEPIQAFAMPQTEGDLVELVRTLIARDTMVFLEEVSGFVGKQQPGSAMFKFGRNFGFILGLFQALDVRVELVRPQKWQKAFGLGTASNCASRTEWKNKLKSCAQRLHPALRPTLATGDSILILDYALKSLRLGKPRA